MNAVAESLQMSEFQTRVMDVPEDCNLLLAGGRGGGKSYALALLILRHVAQYGPKAKVLYLRISDPALADFKSLTRELFGKVWGGGARLNETTGVWKLPNGAFVELSHLENNASGFSTYAQNYQGRSFSLIVVDEVSAYSTDAVLNLIRSNLRATSDVTTRLVLAANPGGAGHAWLARRFVNKGLPWIPFESEKGDFWVVAPSTFVDNPYIDRIDYLRQLEASCNGDPELLRAWREGDWDILRGQFFAGCLDQKRVMIPAWELPLKPYRDAVSGRFGVQLAMPDLESFRLYLAGDWGSAAPAVFFVAAWSPGMFGPCGTWFPRGSVLLLDEFSTALPMDPTRGSGLTVPGVALRLKEMCAKWGFAPRGVIDDACFAVQGFGQATSIAEEFMDHGVMFRPAKKGSRIAGWEVMRRMLNDAGKPDVPGLYVSTRCGQFWLTVPSLPRDPRHPEDVMTNGVADHAADAARYAVLTQFNSRPVSDITI
jgi:hypothetical protein